MSEPTHHDRYRQCKACNGKINIMIFQGGETCSVDCAKRLENHRTRLQSKPQRSKKISNTGRVHKLSSTKSTSKQKRNK